jgi:hypothetical protein
MKADELADAIERAGGVLKLQGDNVKCLLPRAAAHLTDELKERKSELIVLLQRRGGRVAAFPHCPRCAGYALYREHNIGAFECQTCGLKGIEEGVARRLV